MRAPLILCAVLMTLLSACTSMPSAPLTIPRPIPQACVKPCNALPEPSEGSAIGFQSWVHEVIHVAGSCIRLHAECVRASENIK